MRPLPLMNLPTLDLVLGRCATNPSGLASSEFEDLWFQLTCLPPLRTSRRIEGPQMRFILVPCLRKRITTVELTKLGISTNASLEAGTQSHHIIKQRPTISPSPE